MSGICMHTANITCDNCRDTKRYVSTAVDQYATRTYTYPPNNEFWQEGLWLHASGKMMHVWYCDWVNEGAYGSVKWLGVDTVTY